MNGLKNLFLIVAITVGVAANAADPFKQATKEAKSESKVKVILLRQDVETKDSVAFDASSIDLKALEALQSLKPSKENDAKIDAFLKTAGEALALDTNKNALGDVIKGGIKISKGDSITSTPACRGRYYGGGWSGWGCGRSCFPTTFAYSTYVMPIRYVVAYPRYTYGFYYSGCGYYGCGYGYPAVYGYGGCSTGYGGGAYYGGCGGFYDGCNDCY